jgi:hypothetical protein
VPFQRTSSFTRGAALLLSTSHVRLSRRVSAFLGQRNEVQQHVEATIATPTETVPNLTRAGNLDGCSACEHGDLRHAEAGPGSPEFGDQPGSDDRLHASDGQQRIEVLTDAGLDVGAERAFLIHEQRDLLGNLADRLFANPIQLAQPRRGVDTCGLNANPTPQRAYDVFGIQGRRATGAHAACSADGSYPARHRRAGGSRVAGWH